MKAVWNGVVLAESDRTVKVEGNHYFPVESLDRRFVVHGDKHTVCPWKGVASYYSVVVDGERLDDAIWYYPEPSRAAEKIRDRVAFSRGVEVVPSGGGSRMHWWEGLVAGFVATLVRTALMQAGTAVGMTRMRGPWCSGRCSAVTPTRPSDSA